MITTIKKIIEVIRKYQPEIVICNAVTDRHPDHGRSSNLVSDACFYAGLQKIETTFDNKLQACWRPKVIYHYIQDQYIHPNLIVDVTNVIAKKENLYWLIRRSFTIKIQKKEKPQFHQKNF